MHNLLFFKGEEKNRVLRINHELHICLKHIIIIFFKIKIVLRFTKESEIIFQAKHKHMFRKKERKKKVNVTFSSPT